jgi:hypothetical protein
VCESGQALTQIKFEELMRKTGIQVLDDEHDGDPNGRGWTESGNIDKKGHNDKWKLSRTAFEEIADLRLRISSLIKTGWTEVLVVTDHGWLLAPNGLGKIDLPPHFIDMKWGRFAVMKETTVTNLQLIPWFWDEMVLVASPKGTSCFKSGQEYSHGGISLQELVVPRISVRGMLSSNGKSRIAEHKWVGLRCNASILNAAKDQKVDIRIRTNDPGSSLIENRIPKGLGKDGTVSLPLANPEDEGKGGFIVLLDGAGCVLHSVQTKMGQ